jgi:MFS family permease
MNIAMLVDLGFSDKQDIAFYVKIPSLIAILIGAYLANKSIEKIELIKTLRISFYSQFIVLILFVNLVIFGVYTKIIMVMLMLALYIMSGFMQVSLLYLFTIFSKGKNSLIVFALISSISSLSRNILTNTFGFLSDLVGWHSMLLFAGLLAIPSLYMLYSFISYDYNKSLIKIKNENL